MSALLTGKVISIDLNTTAKGKNGQYTAWELIYKNSDGEVNTITKHINGYKYNKSLANGLDQLAAGGEFTMEQEKNDGGYWEPKVCYLGIKEATAKAGVAEPSKTAPAKSFSGGGSTYPTTDERKATQTHIIRQSSLGHAVNLLSKATKQATPEQVIAVAEKFEAFVHGVKPTEVNSIADMVDDEID